MFWRSLSFNLPLNSHIYFELFISPFDSSCPDSQLLRFRDATSRTSEYLYCKQVEIYRILGVCSRNGASTVASGMDWLRSDDSGCVAECKDEYLYLWKEAVQGINPVILITLFC